MTKDELKESNDQLRQNVNRSDDRNRELIAQLETANQSVEKLRNQLALANGDKLRLTDECAELRGYSRALQEQLDRRDGKRDRREPPPPPEIYSHDEFHRRF